jgi:hypothetical protein
MELEGSRKTFGTSNPQGLTVTHHAEKADGAGSATVEGAESREEDSSAECMGLLLLLMLRLRRRFDGDLDCEPHRREGLDDQRMS